MIEHFEFSAAELFSIEPAHAVPGNPAWANLRFRLTLRDKAALAGAGIYAAFFDDQLIYIGKYLGKKQAPFQGNIALARWDKHIGTLTLRGRALSFAEKSHQRILALPDHPVVTALKGASAKTLLRDRGMLSTYNRGLFAIQHWDAFQELNEVALARFSFVYVRLARQHAEGRWQTALIRERINEVEDQLVESLQPRCNAVVQDGSPQQIYKQADVRARIKGCFRDVFGDSTVGEAVSTPSPVAPPPLSDDLEDEDMSSAAELFHERLEAAPSALKGVVERLEAEFGPSDALELHYTRTNNGDLRIRSFATRRGQNVFTLAWQPQNKVLCCLAYASVEKCTELGLAHARQVTSASQPLRTQFDFRASDDVDALLAIIHASVKQLSAVKANPAVCQKR